MTITAEHDSVEDQLCARIDELEREKEVLATQLDQAEEERDGLGRMVHNKAVRIQRMEFALQGIARLVEGNLEQTARDIVNGLANGNDIYDDCEAIKALINDALAQGGDHAD